MRKDSIGIFWEVTKSSSSGEKKTPPERTWENDNYLPGLEEALRFPCEQFTDYDLVASYHANEPLIFDIECYTNYFLIAFKGVFTGKVATIESTPFTQLNIEKLKWIVNNFLIVSFNGIKYDIPILTLALNGADNKTLKQASDLIIQQGIAPHDVLRTFKVKKLTNINHIDLFELTPINTSLKLLSGRLHAQRMQDLPFHPDKILTPDQIAITRWYCVNDLNNTELLFNKLKEELEIRYTMSNQYKIDLRSKSDAQIAEAVLEKEITAHTRKKLFRPKINVGQIHYFKVPRYIQYKTPLLQSVLNTVATTQFIVSPLGTIDLPDTLKELEIKIGDSIYRMGIGGLHSCEKSRYFISQNDYEISDWDATSYYPRIVINQKLIPSHLDLVFLRILESIVDRRIKAKHTGNKTEANTLKIVVNGTFGKFGSPYSIFYSPELVIQVTLSGQLSLLMLIEAFELSGIKVISANTDGVTAYYHKSQKTMAEAIVKDWEIKTGFDTEQTIYKALYNRDVNNYFAITDKKPKSKGIFVGESLSKNPSGEIIYDAVKNYLQFGKPITEIIRNNNDIRKFLFVRTVKGGAVKDGEYLGKAIRWYYSNEIDGEIVYASSGNKVPKSDSSRPCMELPKIFPNDIDYQRYENEAYDLLKDLGYEYGQ